MSDAVVPQSQPETPIDLHKAIDCVNPVGTAKHWHCPHPPVPVKSTTRETPGHAHSGNVRTCFRLPEEKRSAQSARSYYHLSRHDCSFWASEGYFDLAPEHFAR